MAIVGYGKMGKLIEQLAPEYGFSVALKLDEFNNANFEGVTADNFRGIDVAVDFSIPQAVTRNAQSVAALGVNLVIGATGWLEHLTEVKQAVETHGIGAVWSPNFSVGVNAFLRVVAEAARLLAGEPEYGSWAWEIHHATKKDAPSGTLLKLVDEMKKAGYSRAIDVSSNRAGAHSGTHEIGFDSAADTITLRHTARSREGFARGALKAAQWIIGKKGFHEFSDIVFSAQRSTEPSVTEAPAPRAPGVTEPPAPRASSVAEPPAPRAPGVTEAPAPRGSSVTEPPAPRASSVTEPSAPRASSVTEPSAPRASGVTEPPAPRASSVTEPPAPRASSVTEPSAPRGSSVTEPPAPRASGVTEPPAPRAPSVTEAPAPRAPSVTEPRP